MRMRTNKNTLKFFLQISVLQGISKRLFPGKVNFVSAVAHLFCLNLLAAFSQPRTSLLVKLCTFVMVA